MSEEAKPRFKRRRLWVGGCLLLLLGAGSLIGVAAWLLLDPNSFLMKPSAVQCACEWGRLDPLPVPLSQVHVTTRGGMFTRELEVTFEGDPRAILDWLKKSPGTHSAFHGFAKPQDLHLEITPGGGAVFAEITVSKNGSRVVIHTYWS